MSIIFCGSKGKTGSLVFDYLKNKGYQIKEVDIDTLPLSKVIKENSIVIDFTNKDVAFNHALICLNNNSHFICGTTAIPPDKIDLLKKESANKNLNFTFNPNFSLGINPIAKFIDSLKDNFPQAKIIESHHISKKDLPSGTALLLKQHLPSDTSIDSLRTTYTSLEHTIILKNDYEEISLTHSVKNKLAYAVGVENELNRIMNIIKK